MPPGAVSEWMNGFVDKWIPSACIHQSIAGGAALIVNNLTLFGKGS